MSPTDEVAPCLSALPTELLHIICHGLDPIGVVSISQTCSRFRSMICIGRQQLIERLLALESLEQYGGGAPTLRVRDQQLEPPYSDECWGKYRWACTGCLRLLSHIHFDNQSLLRLKSRKPLPGSPAAQLVSTWEPSLYGKAWGRRAWKPISQEERDLRFRYRVAIHQYETFNPPYLHRWSAQELRDIGIEGLDDIDDEEFQEMEKKRKDIIFDQNIRDIELVRCGLKRHTRKCNECRYQAGQLRIQNGDRRGTPMVPIQTSRQLRFASAHGRFFPGLPEHLGIPHPPYDVPIGEISKVNGVFVMSPVDVWSRRWTMHMIRCPGCERWQEMRAFRIGDYSPWWVPKINAQLWNEEYLATDYLDALRCNTCFARENGTLALGSVLADFAQYLIRDISLRYMEAQLCWGWFVLEQVVSNLPREYRKPVRHLLRNVHGRMMRSWNGDDFTHSDVAIVKLHHSEFVTLWQRMRLCESEVLERLRSEFWFQKWLLGFHDLEAQWLWLSDYLEKVQGSHEAMAEWALSRDGSSLA